MNRNMIKTFVKIAFFIVTIDNPRVSFLVLSFIAQLNILSRKVPTNTPRVPTIVKPIELYKNDRSIHQWINFKLAYKGKYSML